MTVVAASVALKLKKIVSINNVGRFTKLVATGNVQFNRLTLLYGLNGHGKTTLAGVLRSLATGDRAFIDERATLGGSEPPHVEILLDSGPARFSNGSWSATAPDLEIFDTTFVNDNVFTGEHVGPEHRKNLYEVVVGAAAVAVVKDIDRLDTEARQVAREINDGEAALHKVIQAPFSLEDFLRLVPIPDISTKISECTTRLSATRKQREILSRPQLERVRPVDRTRSG
jgi:wobble nucleotide-excising tRNase